MIQFTSITSGGLGVWVFSWASTGSPFYRVVLNGELVTTVFSPTYTYRNTSYNINPPPLEITNAYDLADSELNYPRTILQWYGNPETDHYLVQEFVDSDWTTIKIVQENGSYIYTYTSPVLADESEHTYRVIGENSLGQDSSGTEVDVKIIRPSIFTEQNFTVTHNGTQVVFDEV